MHEVALFAVMLAEMGNPIRVNLRILKHLGRDELRGPIAVEVGGLLELKQRFEKFWCAGEAAEAEAWDERLGYAGEVDPWAAF